MLTGALNPARFHGSDAVFNIGCAVGAVQSAAEGVWIAMNGRIWDPAAVRKNREVNRFEPAASQFQSGHRFLALPHADDRSTGVGCDTTSVTASAEARFFSHAFPARCNKKGPAARGSRARFSCARPCAPCVYSLPILAMVTSWPAGSHQRNSGMRAP